MVFQRIRDLREDNDLHQETVAKLLNCTQSTYSRYESGKCNLTADILIKLADFYHTSTDYLLGRTNNPAPYPDTKK